MREIRFRGKRIENGEWVYGYFVKGATRYCILHSLAVFDAVDVNPETVGQYTGLKDRNGKEIYEGDIADDGFGNRAVIEWDHTHCQFLWMDESEVQEIGEWCDIIGNIYEHPHLLDGGETE